jgi:excisionase family DNA binding protein
MAMAIDVDEQCLTVAEVAERLNLDRETVRRLFLNEPGVLVICAPRKGRRIYRTLRIPQSVYRRVVTRFTRLP